MLVWIVCAALSAVVFLLQHCRKRGTRSVNGIALPVSLDSVDAHFLSQVLWEKGLLAKSNRVTAFQHRRLDGGVHYSVALLELTFADAVASDVPRSLVIKLTQSGARLSTLLFHAVLLRVPWLQTAFATATQRAMCIKSYNIELQLYNHLSNRFDVRVPKILYCRGDPLSSRFVMLLEDLSCWSCGEPHGFELTESIGLLRYAARFHRSSLRQRSLIDLSRSNAFWVHGGYWFGDKEMQPKINAHTACIGFLERFDTVLSPSLSPAALQMARCLQHDSSRLTTLVHSIEPRCVIHGDYKLSNLFIDSDALRAGATWAHNQNTPIFVIDWQWLGVGNPATDVAYYIHTSCQISVFDDPPRCECSACRNDFSCFPMCRCDKENDPYHFYGANELRLMREYHAALADAQWTFAQFERAYRLNVLYFLLFCLRCKYNHLTVSEMHRYASVPEDGLHLRSAAHMSRLLSRAWTLYQHTAVR